MKSLMLSLIKSKITYLIIVILGLILFSSKAIQLSYSEFTLTTPSGTVEPFNYPAFVQSPEHGVYTLKGKVTLGRFASTIVRVIPDDEVLSLRINNTPLDLSMIPSHARRDFSKGFVYDLKPYLHVGQNDIEITYADLGGLMGVIISSVGGSTYNKILYGLVCLMGLLLAYKFLTASKLKTSIKILFMGALLIRIIYFSVTPPDVRDHDLGDHTGYIEYLATNWAPPPVDYAVGGAFFHPPLYYYTGAIVYKIAQVFEPTNKFAVFRIEQLLSLAYSMGFVLFGLLILDQLLNAVKRKEEAPKINEPKKVIYRPFRVSMIRTKKLLLDKNANQYISKPSAQECEQHLAAEAKVAQPSRWLLVSDLRAKFNSDGLFWIIGALFAFWPVAIIHSVRIGNDPMEYFLFTASLYYIAKWYRDDRKRDLIIASLIGAAAILTKASGEILIAVLAITGLYKMLKSKQYLAYFKLSIAPILILFIAFIITVAPGFILVLQGKRDKLYIDDIDGLSKANLVGNTAANYLWLDVKTFVTEPFTDPYDDRMGRQFFWNYLGKTGLFGEFKYNSLLCINTAVLTSLLEILMLIYIGFGIYHMTKDDFKRQAVILLSGFFLWAGITYMRMTFPANIDFRYIVPIILTFCSLYAFSIMNFERSGAIRLANIGKVLALLFTLSSIVFILGVTKLT